MGERLLFLKLQRNISHHIESGHWDEPDLRVTVLVRVTVVVEDRAIQPSTGCIRAIENVIEVQPEHCSLQTSDVLRRTEGVAKVDVRL